jgi:hypothetical protein
MSSPRHSKEPSSSRRRRPAATISAQLHKINNSLESSEGPRKHARDDLFPDDKNDLDSKLKSKKREAEFERRRKEIEAKERHHQSLINNELKNEVSQHIFTQDIWLNHTLFPRDVFCRVSHPS